MVRKHTGPSQVFTGSKAVEMNQKKKNNTKAATFTKSFFIFRFYPVATYSMVRGLQSFTAASELHCKDRLWLLVDPVEGSSLVGDDLTLLEPESNLLLGVLDGVGTVADVAADIDGEVATDGARGRGKRVGGTEDGWADALDLDVKE